MRLAASLLLGCLALTGCSIGLSMADTVTRPLQPREGLLATARAYASDIRFGLFDDAARLVEPEQREAFNAASRKLRELRITDVSIGEVTFGDDNRSALVHVTYRGFFLNSPFEREIRTVQTWRRAGANEWLVTPAIDALLENLPAIRRGQSVSLE